VIHLDTSFLIRALARGSREDRRLRAWLRAGTLLTMSAIAWAEFLCGPLGAGELELAARVVPEPVPFVAADSVLATQLFALGGRRRGSLADCMIAATAIRLGAAVATTNAADFRCFEAAGLELAAV